MKKSDNQHRCSVSLDIEYYRYILENRGRYSTSQYFNIIFEEFFKLKGLSKVDYMIEKDKED